MTMTPKKPDNSTPEGAAELMRADERTSTEIFAVLSARFPALSEAQAAEQAGLSSRSPAPSARKLRDVLEKVQHVPELAEYTSHQLEEARERVRALQLRARAEALLAYMPRAASHGETAHTETAATV